MVFKHMGIALSIFSVTALGVAGCATQGSSSSSNQTVTANQASTTPSNTVPGSANNSTASSASNSGTTNNSVSAATTASANTSVPGTTSSQTVGTSSNQPATTSSSSTGSTSTAPTSSSSGASRASSTSSVTATHSFPSIVSMAMKRFPGNVMNSSEAPTLLPTANTGSNQLYYRTSDITSGSILSYDVILSSPAYRLAAFSGSTYSGVSDNNAVALPSSPQTKITNSNVQLSSGIVAKEETTGSAKALVWNEGRWKIEVTSNVGTQAPISDADVVASYLHSHFMPVPQSKGTILVNVTPGENAQGQQVGTDTTATITWQEGEHVYQVNTYSHAKNPIKTGLAMTISMKPYTS